ncbi:MAG: amidohydrolase family protein [Methanobacterium sp.]|uniref:amidohydrolase family protein n=1 Tax=Methanobacterium sp. TaxID=2164 RepID=UPI003D64B5F1|nr:amidohydrolase family protein [Methanobacterium sp.]
MITIENATVLYGEEMKTLKANVVIEDHKITEISKNNINKGKKIDARGCIVAPTFINSHVHIGDSIAKDVGDGKSIDKIVKPPDGLKHRILNESKPSTIINSMKQSMNEMIATGTTTFVDFREGGFEGIDLINEAAKNMPIQKIVLGRHDSFFDPEARRADIKKTAKKLIESCDGIGLSGFGEIRDEIASLITKICKKHGKISAIHTAEYEKLQKDSICKTGKSEVKRAIESNFDMLIHVTSLINNDLDCLSNSKSSVVCCPRSNGALSVGIPPINDMFKQNINMLLGTDNIMFNSPNMLREMEYTLKVTRGYYKEYFSPVEIFKMATINAAKVLNLDGGYIEENKLANIIIAKQKSENPILSIINRTEPQEIIKVIKDGKIIH